MDDNAAETVPKHIQLAAEDIIDSLYSSMNGRAIRSPEEVWQALSTPLRQRRQFVASLASDDSYYTVQQWHDWYAEWPLSEKHMDKAVYQWKREFPMNDHTREKSTHLKLKTPDKANTKPEHFATVHLPHTWYRLQSASSWHWHASKHNQRRYTPCSNHGHDTCTLQSMKKRRLDRKELTQRTKRR